MATRIREKFDVVSATKMNTPTFVLIVALLLGLAVLIVLTIMPGSEAEGANVSSQERDACAARYQAMADAYLAQDK